MKQRLDVVRVPDPGEYSPAFRGGLIEAHASLMRSSGRFRYSPAFRGGLIEAAPSPPACARGPGRIPPRFAGASLKPETPYRIFR